MNQCNRAFVSLMGRNVFRPKPWTAHHHPAHKTIKGDKTQRNLCGIKYLMSSGVFV